jgi:hypothetical protein
MLRDQALDREGGHRQRGREQKVVILEENALAVVVGEAPGTGLDIRGGRVP